MTQRGWLRFLDSAGGVSDWLGDLSFLSSKGGRADELFEIGARKLLECAGGDRAGLWLDKMRADQVWEGAAVGRDSSESRQEWNCLVVGQRTRERLEKNREAVVEEAKGFLDLLPEGFLRGMRCVAWLPLVRKSEVIGLAAVATSQHTLKNFELLKSLSAEISSAVGGRSAEERSIEGSEPHNPLSNPAFESAWPVRPAAVAALIETLFESNSEALLILDSKGIVELANARARELLGIRKQDRSRVALETLFMASVRPTLRDWLKCAASEESPPGIQVALEAGLVIRLRLLSVLPPGDRLLVCLEEGSIAQWTERELERTEAELRSVLESVSAGILLADSVGRIRFVNSRLARFFSLDSRTLASLRSYEELVRLVEGRFNNPGAFSTPWRSAAGSGGEPVRDELELAKPPRRVFDRYSRPVFDDQRRRVGWLEVYWDVTSQRHIQSKLIQAEKMAALGKLVSGIAHELNNPLTTIMGYAQLFLGHGLDPSQLSDAQKIYQEAERARRIVKNLLFFSREAKPERSPVDLNEIVERTVALRSYELKVENIGVKCNLAPDLPLTLADPYQLQQVLLNLLTNAEQAILQGRGQGHIWIRTARLPQGRLRLEVADDGPGVSPEIASRIFDPFFTTKPPGVGTGLGLSIVYGIVQQHGGEVAFESTRGDGTKFVVELPILAVPSPEPVRGTTQSALASSTGAARVLVVEDEPTVAQLIADVLREEGHVVEVALDSQEGLTRIARSRYELIICDLRMPRLDGPAFYDALVRAGSPARDRLIFITGDTLAPRTLEFIERHGLPFLAKPFLVEELKLAVNRLLDQARVSAVSPPTGTASGNDAEALRKGQR